jgi:hypothetical protein
MREMPLLNGLLLVATNRGVKELDVDLDLESDICEH